MHIGIDAGPVIFQDGDVDGRTVTWLPGSPRTQPQDKS